VTPKINRIKIVIGIEIFHCISDFEDLVEKSNNFVKDNMDKISKLIVWHQVIIKKT